jgi:hypothetical protein
MHKTLLRPEAVHDLRSKSSLVKQMVYATLSINREIEEFEPKAKAPCDKISTFQRADTHCVCFPATIIPFAYLPPELQSSPAGVEFPFSEVLG